MRILVVRHGPVALRTFLTLAIFTGQLSVAATEERLRGVHVDDVETQSTANSERRSSVGDETFGQGDKFRAGICAPANTTIVEDIHDHAVKGALEGFDGIARLEGSGLGKRFDNGNHRLPV